MSDYKHIFLATHHIAMYPQPASHYYYYPETAENNVYTFCCSVVHVKTVFYCTRYLLIYNFKRNGCLRKVLSSFNIHYFLRFFKKNHMPSFNLLFFSFPFLFHSNNFSHLDLPPPSLKTPLFYYLQYHPLSKYLTNGMRQHFSVLPR